MWTKKTVNWPHVLINNYQMAKLHNIPTLPLLQDVETKAVLKRLNAVHAD